MMPFTYKSKIIEEKIANLPCGNVLEVKIRRRKAYNFIETGGVDHEGTHTIFGQLMQVLKQSATNPECFRMNRSDDRWFHVEFHGEGSID
mmetsp:Transcript_44302/g.32309  ORF Transcript_44302/g.32309 Transcript_44302/m.32309 type:complete len:90 (+) Transcript_44302:1027-1296(+)